MLALSIRQPWAWAIIHAGKDIENRDWWTNYRGPFFVHASKGMTRAEYADAISAFPHIAWPHRDSLQRGGIIGRAKIVQCVTDHASPWFFGHYGFVLAEQEALDFIELKGSLGFFEVGDADR